MKITHWGWCTHSSVLLLVLFGSQDQGKLRVEPASLTIQLERDWYKNHSISGRRGEVGVEARTYDTQQITLTATDPKGSPWQKRSTWTLRSHSDFGTLDRVTVKKNETTVVRGGDPLTIKTSVSRRADVVSVNYCMVGQAGEVYGPRIVNCGKPGQDHISGRFRQGSGFRPVPVWLRRDLLALVASTHRLQRQVSS